MQSTKKFTLSRTSKLDGVMSWSLQAVATCPGSVAVGGGLVPACSGCYATTGFYVMGAAVSKRADNLAHYKMPEWVSDMVGALDNSRYFRWFDSGDMHSMELAEKIFEVMQKTPWVKHWLPTRMAKFAKFADIIAKMQSLPNVMVRFSSDSITGEFTPGLHGSVIVPTPDDITPSMALCGAYDRGGKCGGCRACYDKSVAVIAYPQHGRKMAKVFKIMAATA